MWGKFFFETKYFYSVVKTIVSAIGTPGEKCCFRAEPGRIFPADDRVRIFWCLIGNKSFGNARLKIIKDDFFSFHLFIFLL